MSDGIGVGPDLLFLPDVECPAYLAGYPAGLSGFFLPEIRPDNPALPDMRPNPRWNKVYTKLNMMD